MSGFFVVKGELAAWALGLDEEDCLTPNEVAELAGTERDEPSRRRKWRLGHEWYRTFSKQRRELLAR